MKKGLFMAACVAATLSSCTQNEAIETIANEAINFSTYVGQNTRAGILDLPGLKLEGKGFYVLGYSTGADAWEDVAAPTLNFMLNDNVTWNSTTPAWEYTNIKYWPNSVDGTNLGKVSFFAYAPADAAVVAAPLSANAAAAPTITYTCPTEVASQVDLVADAQKDMTKASNTGKVDFTFGHLLSKIAFAAKKSANYANAEITVKGLTVTYGTGLVQKNVYKMDSEAWSTLPTDAENYAAATGTVYSDANGMLLGWNTADGADAAIVSNFSTLASTNFLMMIPQVVAADGDLKATMTYDVYDAHRQTTVTNTVTVDLPAITWEMGKQYTYHLNVTLTGVEFDVTTVGDWSDGTQPNGTEI